MTWKKLPYIDMHVYMNERQVTLLETQHWRSLDRSVPLLHKGNQLLQELELFFGVPLTQDRQQVLLDTVF